MVAWGRFHKFGSDPMSFFKDGLAAFNRESPTEVSLQAPAYAT